MNMEYTIRLNTILSYARQEAERIGNDQIFPDHLMLAILRLEEGTAYDLLVRADVNMNVLKERINNHMHSIALQTVAAAQIPFSPACNRIFNFCKAVANAYKCSVIGSIHLLLSILREHTNFPSMMLAHDYGLTYAKAIELYPLPHPQMNDATHDYSLDENDNQTDDNHNNNWPSDFLSHIAGGFILLNSRHIENNQNNNDQDDNSDNDNDDDHSSKTPALDLYGRDLTEMARRHELDPVVGREDEIQRVMEILYRRKKNNPILIGDPGVGKSAIVEGLAQMLIHTKSHSNRRIISLDMASMVAGTTYRGQFEQRMKEVISELREHKEIILFIDEIHTLIGAGNAQGTLDAANILKPALARGEVQCIGATTTSEYRTTIEKDGALERRFQKILIRPTTPEETYHILRRLSETYGQYHHVHYTDAALRACANLTDRYIADRYLPDKAIDAMDEAGSSASQPDIITEITTDHIAAVVSRMSGIPIQRVAQEENEQLRHMDAVLRQHVIGQDRAIERIVRAIRRSRLGLRDPHRPIGTFFFLGPTGVGKTYLAQSLAEEMFGSRDAIIRFDMSEYMEKHTVSLLVGAPPGYIAHEDGGKLTEAVRRRPYSIVLFDEIEKAHPDIFNVLLQVLDEGRMTDRQGHSVDFRNTIIILTSNIGTRQLHDFGTGLGFDAGPITTEQVEHTLHKALEKAFPPEFVNRIDDIITFSPLTRASLAHIINIEVDQLTLRLRKSGHRLFVSDKVRQQLLDISYDPQKGARPIRRAVQTQLEDLITERLLNHPEQKSISISVLPETIKLTKK